MAEPDPILDADRPKAVPPSSPIRRADWLVGADEGLADEMSRVRDDASPAPPKLSRPDGQAVEPARPRLTLVPPVASAAAPSAPAPSELPKWDPAPSSVPRIPRLALVPRPTSSATEVTREFPMDDAEERARIAAQVAEEQAREAEVAARPHTIVSAQEFALPAPPLPWWMLALDRLRTDRRVQLVALLVVLAFVAWAAWPRPQHGVSIATIKQHPERWADHEVQVEGRVAEVFPVGDSWAWTLVQGRDTIVVFSRVRGPKPRAHVTVQGTVSRGVFGGESRLALFESTR